MSKAKVSRNQVYSNDMSRLADTGKIEMAQGMTNQGTGQVQAQENHKWSTLLNKMIGDCSEVDNNVNYYSAIQARMHKNLNEREIEFGSHQEVSNFAFQKDILVASSKNGLIYAYKVTDKSIQELAQIPGHFTEIESLEVARGGSLVFSSSKNNPLMVSMRKAQSGGLSSQTFESTNLDNHLGMNSISFRSLTWIEQLSTLVALDHNGVVRFIRFDPQTNSLKQVVNLDDVLPEMKGKAIGGVAASRDGLVVGILEKGGGASSLKVLNLSSSQGLTLEGSESLEAGSEISDFSVSDGDQFIAIRTNTGTNSIWRRSQGGNFARATPTDIAIPADPSSSPKISISGQGNYFTISDSESTKILVFKSPGNLQGGPDGAQQLRYTPSLGIETTKGLQKMTIVNNEKFVVGLFNNNSIKLFSIEHQDHTDDQVFGLRKRNSSLLGAERYQEILKQLKNTHILHHEVAFDGSRTFFVSKRLTGTNTQRGENSKEWSLQAEGQNTPSQLSMLGSRANQSNNKIAIHEDGSGEEDDSLTISIWNTTRSSNTQIALESSFKIPLDSLNNNDILLRKVSSMNAAMKEAQAINSSAEMSPKGLFRFRGVAVNLRKIEQDFFFRASRDFSTILLGSENHIHIWKREGTRYEIQGSMPVEVEKKIDSLSFLGKKNDFVVGGRDNKLRIYSAAGQLTQILEAHSLRVSSSACSSSGDMIVTGSMDRSLKVWLFEKPKKGQHPGHFSEKQHFDMIHQSRVEVLSVSEDTKLIISSSETEALVFTKKELTEGYLHIQTLGEAFSQILISGDGKYVATRGLAEGGASSKVKLWQVVKKKLALLYELGESKQIALSKESFRDMFFLSGGGSLGQDQGTQGQGSSQINLIKLKVRPKIENNFEMDQQILKLFNNKEEFIDQKYLNLLIQYIEEEVLSKVEEVSEEIQVFKKELIVHGRINLLLLAILARDPVAISEILEKFGYQPFFYQKGLDPFNAAMKINDAGSLNVIAEYLENNEDRRGYFVTHNNFIKAMETSNIPLKKVFAESFTCAPLELDWAKIKPPAQFPLNTALYDANYSNSNFYDHDLRDSIEESRKFYSKFIDDNSKMDEVRLVMTQFKAHDKIYNRDGYTLLKAINKLPDELVTSDVKFLIRHFWYSNYGFLMFFALFKIYAAVSFIVMLVVGSVTEKETHGTLSIIFNIILLILEILAIFKGPLLYFSQIVNILDLYQHSVIPVAVLLSLNHVFDETGIAFNMFLNFTMAIACFRVLFALRIFDAVRYLVTMILDSMIDMVGFTIISLGASFAFATVNMNLTKTTDENPTFNPEDYFRSWKDTYEYYFGNWGDIQEMNGAEFAAHMVNSAFIALIMANLLIAIISETFNKYAEKRELVDFREMLDIMLELGDFISYFMSKKKGEEEDEPAEGKYICFVVKQEEEEDTEKILEGIEKLDEKNNQILERIDRVEEALKELVNKG